MSPIQAFNTHPSDPLRELLSTGNGTEPPPAEVCLQIARLYQERDDPERSLWWSARVTDSGEDPIAWQRAVSFIEKLRIPFHAARHVKLALLGSYTTVQFRGLLKLAAHRTGIALDIYESPYGQYQQEILDPASSLYAFAPDVIVLAVHEGEVRFSADSGDPAAEVEQEVARWQHLWTTIRKRSHALVIHHNFVVPTQPSLGHLAVKRPDARYRMLQHLNTRLADSAPDDVVLVDCERIASEFGKSRWFDPRYWHMARLAVSLGALPVLARHTARVLAGALGLGKKCVVLDLDNTLWGGVIGEDRITGIKIGDGAEGEAFSDFQDYLLELKSRGVILAVCSKNNEADALEPFAGHPGMRLKLDDFAAFVCNWDSKPDNLRRIAGRLNLGLDSLVMVDDNPVERQQIRHELPQVEVPPLPADPARYRYALANSLLFETPYLTADDSSRAAQYRTQVSVEEARSSAASLEEFHRGLEMKARILPFREADLPRIAQLVGKTNQFNLTTVRHSPAELRQFMSDPDCIHLSLRLSDRYGDYGLISVLIAHVAQETAHIGTWLMSCRVLGREVERHLLRHLCLEAAARGCKFITGEYVQTAKNGLVKDLYRRFEFMWGESAGVWRYDLAARGAVEAAPIETIQ